jgi:hypothetical protein
MHGLLARPIDIRPGNTVMYYPEANALVPRTVDPGSKTPAFKGTLVTVEAMFLPPANEVSVGGSTGAAGEGGT